MRYSCSTLVFTLLLCFILGSGSPGFANDALGSALQTHDPTKDQGTTAAPAAPANAASTNAATSSTTGTVRVNTSLNIRSAPWGSIIGSFRNGEQVRITGRNGEWYKIDWNGREAYVHSNYVTADGNSTVAGASGATGSTGATGVTGTTGNTGSTNPGVTTPTVPAPAPGASGGRALLGYLQQAGLTGEKLKLAWSIGMAESGGNPRAFNGNSRTGDQSYGLFQINMINSLGPARRRQFGLSSNDQLYDPMTNIRAMMSISSNATNWRPWGAYTNGSYRRFYNQYPPR